MLDNDAVNGRDYLGFEDFRIYETIRPSLPNPEEYRRAREKEFNDAVDQKLYDRKIAKEKLYYEYLEKCFTRCDKKSSPCEKNCCKKRCRKGAKEWSNNQAHNRGIGGDSGGTYFGGVTANGVAGGGGVVAIGGYINTKDMTGGAYVSIGGGVGANLSAGIEGGYMSGSVDNFAGTSSVTSGSVPSGVGGSVMVPHSNPSNTGSTIGWGLGTNTIVGGGSQTIEQTFITGN